MQSLDMNHAIVHRLRPAVLATGLCLLAAAAHAQVYRSVGPDGRVSFSDSPPSARGSEAPKGPAEAAMPTGSNAALPYELRQTVQRYPVTLYTTTACEACSSGRQLLTQRGVPFTEKTVSSNADIDALKKITGADGLPALGIGQQQLKGFSESEWNQYLDAAGYPKRSQLPASWRAGSPTPLTAPARAAAPSASAAASAAVNAATEPPVSPPKSPTNPAGIRF